MSIRNGFVLLLLQKLSLNLFTIKKVSVLLFRCYHARIIFMICCDASYLVSDNPLQTNETTSASTMESLMAAVAVCTDLCKSFSYSFHEMQNFFLSCLLGGMLLLK